MHGADVFYGLYASRKQISNQSDECEDKELETSVVEYILIGGNSQADQSGCQGLVELLWQIPPISPLSHFASDSKCLGPLGHAEIQKAARPLAQGDSLVGSHCSP